MADPTPPAPAGARKASGHVWRRKVTFCIDEKRQPFSGLWTSSQSAPPRMTTLFTSISFAACKGGRPFQAHALDQWVGVPMHQAPFRLFAAID